MQATAHGRRPRWWRGNLFKAFYWACVGQPDALSRKVDKARQQLMDIQAKEIRNTGESCANIPALRHHILDIEAGINSLSEGHHSAMVASTEAEMHMCMTPKQISILCCH